MTGSNAPPGPVVLRSVLAELGVYRPGRRPPAGRTDIARLASNELPHRLDDDLVRAISDQLAAGNRYPDPAASELVEALARKHRVETTRVVAGCGSVQLLQELISATCDAGDEVVFPWRSFEAYPTLTRIAGAVPVPVPLAGDEIDLAAVRAAVTNRTRLIILCTPNNPIGPALGHDDVVTLLASLPGNTVVAIDEAYAEYVTDSKAVRGPALLSGHRNVVILRTFSKAFGLAGLRVGYAVCGSVSVADALRALHLPFSVSMPAQVAALAALQVEARVMLRVREATVQRDVLAEALRASGWHVPSAQGNFVFLSAGSGSIELSARFDAAGVLTRCFEGEGVRITVGTQADNARVVQVVCS